MAIFKKIHIGLKKLGLVKAINNFCNAHIVGCWLAGLNFVFAALYIIFINIQFDILGFINYELFQSLVPEIIGINITVLIIDLAVRKREEKSEIYYKFESDIQSSARYLFNIKQRLEQLIALIQKGIDKETILMIRLDLSYEVNNPPKRESFSHEIIVKEKGERISEVSRKQAKALSTLSQILSDEENSIPKYIKIRSEVYRIALSILKLRISDEELSEMKDLQK